MMKARYVVRYVGGPIARLMRSWGWAGVTLPVPFWGALILIWNTPAFNVVELRHEIQGHVPQVVRMGTIRYVVTILYQYARYGYDGAPMELEARRLTIATPTKEDT